MKSLDAIARHVTGKAYARFGRAYGELLVHWPVIAGEELAACARPVRIVWPRVSAEKSQREHKGQRIGGTLEIEAMSGRALELQHDSPRIIEKINRYYGYGAISALKIRQNARFVPQELPRDQERRTPEPDRRSLEKLDAQLGGIENEALQKVLRSLGAGVLARTNRATR